MAVLYRKYRPQSFSDVLSQKPITQTLQNQVKNGTVAHAYLFTGSRGVGKTSVARILAKAVNCIEQNNKAEGTKQDGEACGVCANCLAVAAGNFLDLVEIDAASNTGVDNIRELIEHVKFSPSVGKFKVFIIDEVHMLSKGAFNALLKTLEEPPKHAIFILATTEIHKLPATIISRTQRFDFKAYSPADLLKLLENISQKENLHFNTEVLQLVAQNADGSARDALSLFEKLLSLGDGATLEESRQLLGVTDRAVSENLLKLIASGRAKDLPDFFTGAAENGLDYLIFNRDFLEILRQLLVFKISGSLNAVDKNLTEIAGSFSVNDLIFIIRLFLKSYKDLPNSPDAQIPLLLAAVEAAIKKGSGGQVEGPRQNAAVQLSAKPENKKSEVVSPLENVKEPEQLDSAVVNLQEENSLPETGQASVDQGESMELPEFRLLWPKVIEKIRQVNGPLASLLRTAHLEDVENGKVILGVKFLFNKQNLDNAKNFSVISQKLREVTGKNLSIMAKLVQETKVENVGAAEMITDALKIFGGEVIE